MDIALILQQDTALLRRMGHFPYTTSDGDATDVIASRSVCRPPFQGEDHGFEPHTRYHFPPRISPRSLLDMRDPTRGIAPYYQG